MCTSAKTHVKGGPNDSRVTYIATHCRWAHESNVPTNYNIVMSGPIAQTRQKLPPFHLRTCFRDSIRAMLKPDAGQNITLNQSTMMEYSPVQCPSEGTEARRFLAFVLQQRSDTITSRGTVLVKFSTVLSPEEGAEEPPSRLLGLGTPLSGTGT